MSLAIPLALLAGMAVLPLRAQAQECEPCVTLDAGEVIPSICAGDSARVLLRATNCGNVTGSIQITGPGGLDHTCPSLAPGDFCEFVHAFKTEPECPREGEFVFQYDATLTTTACATTAHDDGFAKFACCTPRIEIEKICPDTATIGEPFEHNITVRVPEGSCDVEATVYDTLCFFGITPGLAPSVTVSTGSAQNSGSGIPGGEPYCFPFVLSAGTMTAGQETTFTIQITVGSCTQDISVIDVAEVKATCGAAEVTARDDCDTKIACHRQPCEPCVVLDASEENPQICAGDDAIVILKATNCGTEKGRIVITGPGDFEYVCESVDPGQTCETTDHQKTDRCPDNGEFVFEYHATIYTDDCDQTPEDPGFAKFFCCQPEIHVAKRCPEEAADGETFTYSIAVTIPEGACGLEKITITDVLCGDVVYADNANIEPNEAPPVGESGTLVWDLGPYTAPALIDIEFDVTVKADCPADECENIVHVEGECGNAKVSDADTCDTKIICEEGTGCPRTIGFWKQQAQCAEGEGGNVKYSCEEVTLIADCVDDNLAVFSWASDLADFGAVLDPPTPVSKREQALRQLAAFTANYCAGILPVTANNGDLVNLDLSLPVSGCSFATTVGELMSDADALFVSLAGGSEDNDAYTAMKDCLDHVNNHIGIPYLAGACHIGKDIQTYLVRLSNEEQAARRAANGGNATGIDPAVGSAELLRPTPNPFTRTTTMNYAVPAGSSERVEIAIYNTSGQRIRNLVSETKGAGRYSVTWDGRSDSGESVTPGVYFYRVSVGAESSVSRVVFVK